MVKSNLGIKVAAKIPTMTMTKMTSIKVIPFKFGVFIPHPAISPSQWALPPGQKPLWGGA
jgi:hypothetical protein